LAPTCGLPVDYWARQKIVIIVVLGEGMKCKWKRSSKERSAAQKLLETLIQELKTFQLWTILEDPAIKALAFR
jgi:hypothetical protein